MYNVFTMVRKQLYLTEQLNKDLTFTALRRNETVADVVRRILQEGLEREKKKRRGSASVLLKIAGKGGNTNVPRDLSENLFDYLYGDKSSFAQKPGKRNKG